MLYRAKCDFVSTTPWVNSPYHLAADWESALLSAVASERRWNSANLICGTFGNVGAKIYFVLIGRKKALEPSRVVLRLFNFDWNLKSGETFRIKCQ
jgi:hypothetical protein